MCAGNPVEVVRPRATGGVPVLLSTMRAGRSAIAKVPLKAQTANGGLVPLSTMCAEKSEIIMAPLKAQATGGDTAPL